LGGTGGHVGVAQQVAGIIAFNRSFGPDRRNHSVNKPVLGFAVKNQ
jgi:hypothetical protein